jgi:hypothetical protein
LILRSLGISILVPVVWRLSPARAAKALHSFATTEVDSAWQSLHASQFTDCPIVRSELFRHALEEIHHGDLFAKHAKALLPPRQGRSLYRRAPLIESTSGWPRFYADEYLGEKDVTEEFKSYISAAPESSIQNLFRQVQRDELGHLSYLERRLALTCPNATERRRELLKARNRYLWNLWVRLGQSLGNLSSSIILSAIYFAFGPLLKWRLKSKPEGIM